MAEEPDVVLEGIKAGDYDGHLVDLIDAVRLRFQYGDRQQKWRIDHEAVSLTEDDLTLGEARMVEQLTGTNWGLMNPVSSGEECLAIIAVCLHTRHGKTLRVSGKDGPSGQAWDEASQIPVAEAVASISSYEVERAPKS